MLTIWERRAEHPEAQCCLKLEKGGVFANIGPATFNPHVRGRMLNAVGKGCPELAQEADKVLSRERSVGWVDDERQAWISAPVWRKDKAYGEGKCSNSNAAMSGIVGATWTTRTSSDELASALGLQPGEDEECQCIVLHPAARVRSPPLALGRRLGS